MRDEEIRERMGLLQVAQQIDHLRPNRDIERADRLIQHKEARSQRKRASNIDALPLPAGELMRIPRQRSLIQPDLAKQLTQPRRQAFRRRFAVDRKRLSQYLAHGHSRIQRRIRVLKDDLHPPPKRTHRR